MTIVVRYRLLALSLVLGVVGWGTGAMEAQAAPVDAFKLDNGLRVWHLPRRESPSVAIALVIRAGGRYENDENNGVSHFLEHFLFTETERWSEGEVFQVMNRLGGENNAVTGRERTTWYNIAAPEYFEPAMDWMAEVVLHSKMAEEHIEKERQIIFRENGGPDSWFVEWCNKTGYGGITTRELYGQLFPGSALALPVIGQNHSLEAMDHATLTGYYDKHYLPNNAVLLVVGNIEREAVEDAARRYFGEWQAGPEVAWPEEPPMPENGPIRIIQRGMDIQDEGAVWIGARTGGVPDADQWPLTVMGHILRERLFQSLRIEQGLVYYIGAFHTTYSDVGDFRVVARSKREHLPRVEEGIRIELDRMKAGDIAPTEVADAQKTLIGRHALAMESNYAHAFALLEYTHLPEETPIPEYEDAINGVTAADIQRVASRYLTPERSYTAVYDPICTVNELVVISAIATAVALAGVIWRVRRIRNRARSVVAPAESM